MEGHSPRYLRINGEWKDHDRYALTVEEWRASGGRTTGEPG
jgi:ribosomal-protein-alanine N-acetyltransferase